MTRHIYNLARNQFFIPQNSRCMTTGLSWAAQRRRPHGHRPSRSPVVKTPYLDHRPRPAIHVTSRAQQRFCACNNTSRTCPQ